MFKSILSASGSDDRLAAMVDEAGEYAQIYLLAKSRKKGCDGAGELATLKEEFRDAVDTMLRYCKAHGQLSDAGNYELDAAAEQLAARPRLA